MSMNTSSFLAACTLATLANVAVAEDFDGSKPLICAPVQAYDCVPNDTCTSGTPQQIGLPSFLRINIKEKTVQGTTRTTAIKLIEQTDTQILMMGTELGMGWSMSLDRQSGNVSISMTSQDGSAVMFGSCTTL